MRLITRRGDDFMSRFRLAVAAVTALPVRSFLIDGEPIVTNDDGPPVFHLIHHKRRGDVIVSKWHTVLNRPRRSTHWVKVKNL